ncbi:MAG: DUF4116 domain-containing protein [Treponema sp.]|jgi:hypothetical protein|nr:DUF4116 domain-containing protein [Treponema sp.]
MVIHDALSYEEKLAAVRENGLSIMDMAQTRELCLEAVKQNGKALQYIKDTSEEFYLEAVKQNGFALQFIEKQTEELCMAAVSTNGLALQFVKKQTEELCMAAISQNPLAYYYVQDKTEAICAMPQVTSRTALDTRIQPRVAQALGKALTGR